MIIPENTAREPHRKDQFVQWVIDVCMNSKKDRKDLYDRRQQFFLYGGTDPDDVIYNRIESHLDLVASFLYSQDHAQFSLSAPLNSPDVVVKQYMAVQDTFNNDFRDAGMFDFFGDAILGSLVYDSIILKSGWSDVNDDPTCKIILPWQFGVFSEELTELESQPAFTHVYHIDYDNACQRLTRAGLAHRIPDLVVVNTPFESPFPELLTRMIISATGGENLGGTVSGSVNPTYSARASYHAKVDRPLVEFHEVTIWDDECEDYRLFFVVSPGIVIGDSKRTIDALKRAGQFKAQREQQEPFYNTQCNPFFPREHPFTLVRPYNIYEYFWGKAHIESLIPLQEWSNERLEQIHDILERQAYPPRVGSGFMGLSDEKMDAFGGADSWVLDQLPQASIKELYPQMPPDIFADYMSIGQLFIEASGLTEVLQGKGTAGVRSKDHAKQLSTTGSGRIKKAAIRLESPLVRFGNLNLKLKMRNDAEEIIPDPKEDGKQGDPFYYANLGPDYALRVAGHSHSPLFADDTKEMAAFLFKSQSIDQEGLLRLLNPPDRDNLIHALRARNKMKAEAQAKRAQMGVPEPGARPNGKGRAAAHA
jgi:hypothetical protein